MKNRNTLLKWAFAAVLAVVGYYVYSYMSAPLTLSEAIAKQKVTVTVTGGGGDNGSSANITLTRVDGVSGTVAVRIPAGTKITNPDADGQPLVTASDVVIVLRDDLPSVSQTVSTYCLNEFLSAPVSGAKLALPPTPDDGAFSEEETETYHQLLICLDRQNAATNLVQVAVWAVHDGWLQKSPAEARSQLVSAETDRLKTEWLARAAVLKQTTLKDIHGLSDEDADQAIQTALTRHADEIARKAEEQTAKEIDLLKSGKDALGACGQAEAPFFAE